MRKLNYKICYNQRWPIFRNLKLLRFNRRKWFFVKKIIDQKGLGYSNTSDLSFTPLFSKINTKTPLIMRKNLLHKNKILLLKRLRFNDICLKKYQLRSLLLKKKKYSNMSGYFLANLNSRLDYILYKTRWFSSLSSLNQFLLHEGVLVNGKPFFKGNICLKEGDLVSFNPRKRQLYKNIFDNLYNFRSNPIFNLIEFDYSLLSFVVKDLGSKSLFKTFYSSFKKDSFWSTRAF